jgi:glycosyltransferase involved in cell wall biosynthesis
MDVALINGSRRYDGHYAGHFVQYEAALRRAGIPFRVYTCVDPSLAAEYPDEGTRVVGLHVPIFGARAEMAVNRFLPVFARRLRRVEADLVHANDAYLGRLVAYRDNVVVSIADLRRANTRYDPRIASSLHNFHLRYVRRARGIICHTETVRREILDTLKMHPDRVHVVTPATWQANLDSVAPRSPDPPTEGAPWTLLYIADDRPHKRLGRFVDVLATLDGRFRGHLVSRISPARATLLQRRAGGPARLEIDSNVPDLSGTYRSAHVLVFPSVHEGFGFPPLEAMSQGLPVIASRASCLPEVVGDGGALVDPDDVPAWSREVLRLASDTTQYRDASRRALARARTFSPERTTRELLSAYTKSLDSGPAA